MISPIDFFQNYTYTMVFSGTVIIGLISGLLGTFLYLRKQSLMSDVIAHSAFPGTLTAFLAAVFLGLNGRNTLTLVVGATVFGLLASALSHFITARSKIAIDAAMAIILSLFFALGILLLRIITNGPFPGKGGIQDYLFGNASVITLEDLFTNAGVALLALIITVLFWKEFALYSFDPAQAHIQGFSRTRVETVMFIVFVLAIVIGVKAVGFVLMVACVITPPAIARQWCASLPGVGILASVVGAISCGFGSYLSIALGNVPTGPCIVLVLFTILIFSLLFSPSRSLLTRALTRRGARAQLRGMQL